MVIIEERDTCNIIYSVNTVKAAPYNAVCGIVTVHIIMNKDYYYIYCYYNQNTYHYYQAVLITVHMSHMRIARYLRLPWVPVT